MSRKYVRHYPYQDRTTAVLPKETWCDIPGFEKYYQASTLGRVRSLDRYIPHSRHGKQFVAGRILSQSISIQKNLISRKKMVVLRITLMVEGKVHYLNTARVIYTTFVQPINYENDRRVIIQKDCNGFNCSVENLVMVSVSEKQKRVFRRKRTTNYLKEADRSTWKKPFGGKVRAKPVFQYKGKKVVRKFSSIREASSTTGFGEKEIINVAKGRYKQWKGFIWRYAEPQGSVKK